MKKILTFTIAAFACLQGFSNDNPFFREWNTPFGVPPFEEIKLEHFMPAYQAGIAEETAEIWAIIRNPAPPTFENTIVAMDRAGALLRRTMPVFNGISSVNSNTEVRELSRQFSSMTSQHRDNISMNPLLFQRVKAVYDQKDRLNLNGEQRRLLHNIYRSFVNNGANLSVEQQEQLRKINTGIATTRVEFAQNVLAETANFTMEVTDRRRLGGLTPAQLTEAQSRAERAGNPNAFFFGLDNPSVMPFLENADDRELRAELGTAFINRGNNNNEHDNKEVIQRLITLRLERAKLLGYDNFAQLAISERMAQNPENVMNFLNKMWTPSLETAKRELQDIEAEMRRQRVALPAVPADWRYFQNKVKQRRFSINQAEISEYFEINNVLQGIYYVCNRLWGITFEELKNIPLPHPEATAWKTLDQDGTVLGIVYFDMHPRPGSKGGGAWCGIYRIREWDENGNRIPPVITIGANFTRASGNKPALLTPDEVTTFFHEFGHALFHLFSTTKYNGTNRAQADFMEFPAQIMEHWAFQPEVLRQYARHYRTGRVIPNSLIRRIEQNEQYGQGFQMTERIITSLLDMEYHMLTEIPKDFDAEKFEHAVREKYGVISQIPARHRPTHLRHSFGEFNYYAGYYMYMWAEQLDSDAFEAFKQTGDIFNQELAHRLRFELLSRGGVDDSMILYKNFRGKEPDPSALLRNRGLIR